jgi:hypothetical protein
MHQKTSITLWSYDRVTAAPEPGTFVFTPGPSVRNAQTASFTVYGPTHYDSEYGAWIETCPKLVFNPDDPSLPSRDVSDLIDCPYK